MLNYHVKIGLVPIRRDVTPRPGIFNWEKAEERCAAAVAYKTMKNIVNAPFVEEMRKTTANMYRLGWDERNGGNISCLLDTDKVAEYLDINEVKRTIPLGFDADPLIGNKNMIARILSDKRYCGDRGYPEIIDEETFRKVAEKRKKKSASQQKTEAQAVLRKKCAGRMTPYIESEVLHLLNCLTMNSEQIVTPQTLYTRSQRLDTLKSELEELISQLPVDENRAREVLREIAAEMYADIDPREYETQRLRRLFQKEAPRSELDANLITMSLSAVLVDGNGNVKIRLKNDQIVERGEQNG